MLSALAYDFSSHVEFHFYTFQLSASSFSEPKEKASVCCICQKSFEEDSEGLVAKLICNHSELFADQRERFWEESLFSPPAVPGTDVMNTVAVSYFNDSCRYVV